MTTPQHQYRYKLGPRPMDVAALLPSGWMRLANNHRLSEAEVATWRELVVVADQTDLNRGLEALGYLDGIAEEIGTQVGSDYSLLLRDILAWRNRTAPPLAQQGVHVDGREIDKLVEVATGYVENPEKKRFGLLAEMIERGAFNRGYAKAETEHADRQAQAFADGQKRLTGEEQRSALLRVFGEHVDGMSDHQAAEKAGLADGSYTYWKRCGDLRTAGLIVYTGETIPGPTGRQVKTSAITSEGYRVLRASRNGGS